MGNTGYHLISIFYNVMSFGALSLMQQIKYCIFLAPQKTQVLENSNPCRLCIFDTLKGIYLKTSLSNTGKSS